MIYTFVAPSCFIDFLDSSSPFTIHLVVPHTLFLLIASFTGTSLHRTHTSPGTHPHHRTVHIRSWQRSRSRTRTWPWRRTPSSTRARRDDRLRPLRHGPRRSGYVRCIPTWAILELHHADGTTWWSCCIREEFGRSAACACFG
jgi:hypothetical protein